MHGILSGPVFTFVLFPVGSVALGIAVKFVSRNDKFSTFRKEDLAVGLDLWLTAVLLLVVSTSDHAARLNELTQVPRSPQLQAQVDAMSSQIMGAGWYLLLLFGGLWAISTTVRKSGWRSADNMTGFLGITLPLVSGVLALVFVMAVAR